MYCIEIVFFALLTARSTKQTKHCRLRIIACSVEINGPVLHAFMHISCTRLYSIDYVVPIRVHLGSVQCDTDIDTAVSDRVLIEGGLGHLGAIRPAII
ncbi:uncharacterized protein B0J16DRAFT_342170 [Fusarium flagelliforme]|uniref:uncharacterized protein n=1 Tax=Fusarium flagelliforme TaxID=2675880 RepID=UPI001E8E7225|nr:uncharacterized protein B0J16DRAFT_342170 [Fusarium flagelliforme]KAH7185620.1 hypothetical protein B0J16DRAFT_342170 [Fusarium flagelliforme]